MLVHELLLASAARRPEHAAVTFGGETWSYHELTENVAAMARGLRSLGLDPADRVAIFAEKQLEVAASVLGVSAAGGAFVPINPTLRAAQAAYIFNDCAVRVLITTRARWSMMETIVADIPTLSHVFLLDGAPETAHGLGPKVAEFSALLASLTESPAPHAADTEMAGILYTSGSTGNPKGVVFSHRNFVLGAASVSEYLEYRDDDRIINVPPYSFDFGLNQLFSSLYAGVTAVLHNFRTVEDLMEDIGREYVTGVSGVPTVMIQLASQSWPAALTRQIRYMSTTGGRMPEAAVRALRRALPTTDLYLMYGLTEAFRATFLPPTEVDRRPNSIGKAIPRAEILVVRPDGTTCDPDEPGELIQKGPLVTMGYWNDPARTAERFKPAPGEPPGKPNPEIAVYSGDTVTRDAQGFIYYVGRSDEMIKTSGYRVSPTEIEEAVFASGLVSVAAAVGVDDDLLGQMVVVFATPKPSETLLPAAIVDYCRRNLPAYMVPHRIVERQTLPLNPNGKVDRKALKAEYLDASASTPEFVACLQPEAEAKEGFFRQWGVEALELVGLRRRAFENVLDVFRWAFPDRPIKPTDCFVSLSGDSLSYVAVRVGLDELIAGLPANWPEHSIENLERLSGEAEQPSGARIAPEVLVRVLSIIAIVANHASPRMSVVLGAAKMLMVMSGLSYARFNWQDDSREIRVSSWRLMIDLAVPLWIFFAGAFAVSSKTDWSILFFCSNLFAAIPPVWWGAGWYIENLFQFILLFSLISFVPGLVRFSTQRRYLFAALLTAASFSLCAGALLLHLPHQGNLQYLPEYFLWLFAFGWLLAASRSRGQKIFTLAFLGAASVAIFVLTQREAQLAFFDGFVGWLLVGSAILLFGRPLPAPRLINAIAVTIARASLFIYALHWAIALGLPFGTWPIRLMFGAILSIAVWVLWESFFRTCQRYNPEPYRSGPKAARGRGAIYLSSTVRLLALFLYRWPRKYKSGIAEEKESRALNAEL
jgi:acyl-CoA ligase (AMP-forming) (exosortase A-associated)